jgi:hypothetical protein
MDPLNTRLGRLERIAGCRALDHPDIQIGTTTDTEYWTSTGDVVVSIQTQ